MIKQISVGDVELMCLVARDISSQMLNQNYFDSRIKKLV